MPEGSSSAAPVIRPGPRSPKKLHKWRFGPASASGMRYLESEVETVAGLLSEDFDSLDGFDSADGFASADDFESAGLPSPLDSDFEDFASLDFPSSDFPSPVFGGPDALA